MWDRLFGTFLDERSLHEDLEVHKGGDLTRLDDGEEVAVFGVMKNQENYFVDLFQAQHPILTLRSLWKQKSMWRRLKVAVEGAGFYSAAHKDRGVMPRAHVPRARRIRFASTLPFAGSAYALVHFHLAVGMFILVSVNPKLISESFGDICKAYGPVVACLCSLAMINDGHAAAPLLEATRCLFTSYNILGPQQNPSAAKEYLGYFYLLSGLIALFNPEWLTANKMVNSVKAK